MFARFGIDPPQNSYRRVLLVALGVSGAIGLIDEVVWERMLGRAFGATAPATSTVLAIFMAGLSLGAWLVGPWCERRSPAACLRAYAQVELGIAVLGYLSATALRWLPDAYAAVAMWLGFGAATRFVTRTMLCLAVLLPPTLLMGTTLPLVVRVAARRTEISGTVGGLYAANTIGAATGALAAGFALLPALGEAWTLRVASAGNLVAAILALGMLVRARPSQAASAPSVIDSAKVGPVLLGNAAACGFAMLGYEVLWTRTLGMALGASAYAFAAILASVLGAMALGAAIASRVGDRVRDPARAFGLLGASAALTALALLRATPQLVRAGLALLDRPGGVAFHYAMVPGILAAPLVLIPTALSGAALPLGVRAVEGGSGAATTSRLYAANTVGAIIGALLTGFVLLPTGGTRGAAIALTVIGVIAGTTVCVRGTRGAWRIAGISTVAACGLLVFTQPALDPRVFAGGLHMLSARMRHLIVREGLETRLEGGRVLFSRDDATTTVLVERWQGQRSFFVGGKPEASDDPLDARNQLLLGHLPALLHSAPRRGLVVGLGSGMTAGALARHMTVDVAELSPAVREAARQFADWNHNVVDDPRVRILFEDGRTVLRARPDRYDVITVDPIHPYVAGAAALYTRDYFALVRARLNPGGIAAHWLPLYQLGWDDVAGVLRSFLDVFPDATVYLTGGDAILIGGAGPSLPLAARVASGFARPDVASDLARVWIDGPERLVALADCGPAALRSLAMTARPITDDWTWIEFTAPRWAQAETWRNVRRLLDVRTDAPPGATAPEISARRSAEWVAQAYVANWAGSGASEDAEALAAALGADPHARELRARAVELWRLRASELSSHGRAAEAVAAEARAAAIVQGEAR